MQYDAVVVGGGPAGLAAAGWLGRYRRRTLVVDAGEGRNRWAEAMHGLPGSDLATPGELRKQTREEINRYPDVTLHDGRVGAARREGEALIFDLDGSEVRARRAVLATGVCDTFPQVDGFFEHYGADVHHCPSCDGFEARDAEVAVIGWRRDVAGFAVSMLDWASKVRIVTDGHELECEDDVRAVLTDHRVEIHEARAVALVGPRGSMRAIRLESGEVVPCAMAFFSIAHTPNTDLAVALGCALDDEGYVEVDHEGATSVSGVYAAGDLTPGMQLVPVAVGAGTVAGVCCALSLQGEPPLPAHPAPAPDPDEVVAAGSS